MTVTQAWWRPSSKAPVTARQPVAAAAAAMPPRHRHRCKKLRIRQRMPRSVLLRPASGSKPGAVSCLHLKHEPNLLRHVVRSFCSCRKHCLCCIMTKSDCLHSPAADAFAWQSALQASRSEHQKCWWSTWLCNVRQQSLHDMAQHKVPASSGELLALTSTPSAVATPFEATILQFCRVFSSRIVQHWTQYCRACTG
jgi:hypothetical protein